jgi:zinc protease
MLKRYFIPIVVVLAFVVVMAYFLGGHSTRPRDVRMAVPVEHFTLRNGLKVVVMPNENAALVSHMLIVRVGAADESSGKTGLAHYLEHLMFTGTKDYPEGAYDRAVARVGGVQNAYTTRDYTLYYATVPPEHLAMVMAMEADRLKHLDFAPEKAARELNVIQEERAQRVDNSPVAQWSEQLTALTFLNHPYGKPLIGWAEDMRGLTRADAQQFFDTHYRPSTMTLVVAGDVSAREVRRQAQRYYGGLVASEAPARVWPSEPPVRLERRAVMRDARVNEPRLMLQFVAPSVNEGAKTLAMPLSVGAQILGGGDASTLYTALVREQQLATSVSVSYDPHSIGPALLRIAAVPAAGITLEELERALRRELTKAIATPPDEAALARAKTLLSAEIIFAQDGMQNLAQTMAHLFALGLDEQYFYDWSDSVGKVTAAQVQEALRAVVVMPRAVTGHLLPEAVAPATTTPTPEVTDAP